jgi:hypothetical protein
MADVTFTRPDLDTFAGVDGLGLVITGQRIEVGRAVLVGCPMISGHEFWVFQAASWGLLWRSRISCGVLYPNPE